VAIGGDREHQARLDRLAVEEHRAGATVAEVAPLLGAGQSEVFPQQIEEGHVGPHRDAVGVTVYSDSYYSLHLYSLRAFSLDRNS